MFKNVQKQHEGYQSGLLVNSKIATEAKAPHWWYCFIVTIIGHYYTVIVQGLQCCGTAYLEVASS